MAEPPRLGSQQLKSQDLTVIELEDFPAAVYVAWVRNLGLCVFWLCVINYLGAHVPISPGTNEILRRENMAASSQWMFRHLKDYFSQFTEQVIGKFWYTPGINVLCYL